MTLPVGSQAPDATLPSQSGASVTLSDVWKQGPLVLYFYPEDETSICTAEACSFRDSFEVFKDAGASVVGASDDSVEAHANFAKKHRLPFTLLADTDGVLRKKYQVERGMLGLANGRATFVIDNKGVIRHAFFSQFRAQKHVDEALATIKSLG